MSDNQQYYTVNEVAELLQVSPLTVRRWIKRGRLQKHLYRGHFIRISKKEVEAFSTNIINVNEN